MELADADILEGVPYPNESTASEYGTSDAEANLIHDDVQFDRSSQASSVKGKRNSQSENTVKGRLGKPASKSVIYDRIRAEPRNSSRTQTRKKGGESTSNPQPSKSPFNSKVLRRVSTGQSTERRKTEPKSKTRRLSGFYNPQYRELLNLEVNDVVVGAQTADHDSLPGSQIGSSTWTSEEKDLFFSALLRFKRDDSCSIAKHIGTKSEPQVREYILLLEDGAAQRRLHGRIIGFTEIPAALEISAECCEMLERSADALSARHDRREEEVESDKWGDSWLLTKDVSKRLNERRSQDGGQEELDEVLPAANLLDLDMWLELSSKIFMNPGSEYEDENWQNIARDGDTPAIRATAFEDFHSLVVYLTKKLISTTFFCNMSRERATHATRSKLAGVTISDVEAAVDMLKMKRNSHDFWRGCARRCHLDVKEDDARAKNGGVMTYDKVEDALAPLSRARSRSTSRAPLTRASTVDSIVLSAVSTSDEYESADEHPEEGNQTQGQQTVPISLSDEEPSFRYQEKAHAQRQEAYLKAQEEYTEAFDMQTSQAEEQRLWTMLRRAPANEIKLETLDAPVKPRNVRREVEMQDNWRKHVVYRSEWETMRRPVSAEAFEVNRKLKRKRGDKDEGEDEDEDEDGNEEVGRGRKKRSDFVDEEDLESIDGELVDGEEEDLDNFRREGSSEAPTDLGDGDIASEIDMLKVVADSEHSDYDEMMESPRAHFQNLVSRSKVSDDEMSI